MASRPNRRVAGYQIALLALMMAIALVNCRQNGPRHGWNRKWGPLVPHHSFPGNCGICHVPDLWDVLRNDFSFDHEEQTGHPLEGAHARAEPLLNRSVDLAFEPLRAEPTVVDPNMGTPSAEESRRPIPLRRNPQSSYRCWRRPPSRRRRSPPVTSPMVASRCVR